MNDDLNSLDSMNDDNESSLILIRKIRSFNDTNSFAENFKKELKSFVLDDFLQADVNLSTLANKVRNMKPNTLVITRGVEHIVIECEIPVGEYLAFRGKKLIGTGTYLSCAKSILKQMQKEFPSVTQKMNASEIDDSILANFCSIHFPSGLQEKTLRIIKTT